MYTLLDDNKNLKEEQGPKVKNYANKLQIKKVWYIFVTRPAKSTMQSYKNCL